MKKTKVVVDWQYLVADGNLMAGGFECFDGILRHC